ncbi:MAG: iron-sulfur cluster assembly protein [Cytophagales bacterium]|nr:iron-sulfur cluster assembly protein [Cytophagales bacterium]
MEEKNKKEKDQKDPLKEKIISALKTVFDPEIPVDVYELGLIYEINPYPLKKVHILMTLTSPNCPAAEHIPQDVKRAVEALEEIEEASVEITFEPPYSQDMMSEVAKIELGFV